MKIICVLCFISLLFIPSYSNSQNAISSSDIAPLIGKWEGTLTNSNTNNFSNCRITISELGTTDKIRVSYYLGPNKNRPAVTDTQDCPVVERKGHPCFEYTTTTTNNTYYFYIEKGRLVSDTDSANFAVMKYELSKK
jgi:hypothetical protein